MAPMSEAISVRPVTFDSTLLPPLVDASSDARLYTGLVDPEWTIGRFVNPTLHHNPQTDEHEPINSVANGGTFYCPSLGDYDINANSPSRLRSWTDIGSLYPISIPYLSCGRLTRHCAFFENDLHCSFHRICKEYEDRVWLY